MRRFRLLRVLRSQRGSAPIESTFAIVFLLLLALGIVQLALALYGRNVVIASAHEGARAAVERGRSPEEVIAIAERTVRSATGGLVDDLRIEVVTTDGGGDALVRVRLVGKLSVLGPLSLPIPVEATATSVREGAVP